MNKDRIIATKERLQKYPQEATVPVSALLSVMGAMLNDTLNFSEPTVLGSFFGIIAILLGVFAVSELVFYAVTRLRRPHQYTPRVFNGTKTVLTLASGALLLAVSDPMKTAFLPSSTTLRFIGHVAASKLSIVFVVIGVMLIAYASFKFILAVVERFPFDSKEETLND